DNTSADFSILRAGAVGAVFLECAARQAEITRSLGRATGVALELIGEVAEDLHAAAAFDECEARGREAFQLDRPDLRGVLFILAALLASSLSSSSRCTRSAARWKRLTVDHSSSSRSGSRRVSQSVAISASKRSATAPLTALACGNGRGSGSSWKGR